MTVDERFWSKVDATGNCWEWTAYKGPLGYGKFTVTVDGKWVKTHHAHRFAYEALVGSVPDGLDLDHLCRNPGCVNPDHLEPVTHRLNLMRSPRSLLTRNLAKTHCPAGHPYDERNTFLNRRKNGTYFRRCNACFNAYKRRYRARRRSAA